MAQRYERVYGKVSWLSERIRQDADGGQFGAG